jgi:Spy/CpxP family protein refolding chaperone
MKASLLSILFVGAVFTALPTLMAMADDSATAAQPMSPDDSTNLAGDTTTNQAKGDKRERFKEAMAQLNLTDVQKQQIEQIRSTVTDRKERRQQIMGVLTPDQKTKLWQMIQNYKSGQAGTGTTSTP